MTTPDPENMHVPVEPAPDAPAAIPPAAEPAPAPERVEQVETPARRRMRMAGRWLALALILLAAGALAAFILLAQPASRQRDAAWSAATQVAGEAQRWKSTATAADGSNKAAQVRAQQAKDALDVERGRVFLLRATNEITRARMALAQDDAAAAADALTAAEAHLQGLQPPLMVLDQEQLDTLTALFTLAKNDLTRDATLAAQDLDRLQSELDLAEQGLE